MQEILKVIFSNNPNNLSKMREYIKKKIEEITATILTCEDSNRLHFLRGMAMSYVSILRDLETPDQSPTKLGV